MPLLSVFFSKVLAMLQTCPASPRPPKVILLGVLVLLGNVGCGSSTYPVEGKVVSRDGQVIKELDGATVVFEAENGKVSAQGAIEADGSFRLSTHKPNDGAPPGKYRVLISPALVSDLDNPPPPVIDPRFHDFKTSGLVATVESKKNEVLLKVDRAKKRR